MRMAGAEAFVAGNQGCLFAVSDRSMTMNRTCPNCSDKGVSVTRLMVSDTYCANCGEIIGIHWFFRAIFFVVILIATLITGFVVLVDQGPYAALLMITVPIGAIGIIKARISPLVVRPRKDQGA